MSKKKNKHYKPSHSSKLRSNAKKFFGQYENNVTRAAYIKNYDKFIKFCREQYDCKTKEECAEHIEDYIEHLKEKKHTASTIHTYMAPVGLYHGIPLNVMNLPKRYAAENTRSRKERKHYRSDGDENNSKYSRTVELQRCVGIRRNELKNLRGSDLKVDEFGYLCIVVRRGKGGKETYQRILPEDIVTVKSFFDGTENKVFSVQEINNSIDYHLMRAEQAVRAYNCYLDRINNEPGYRKQLEDEIVKRWNEKCIDKKTKKPKHLDKKEIRGDYFVRGKNKQLALEKGLPIVYDRLSLMAVSIYHLSHWRLDVTVSNYMLAV